MKPPTKISAHVSFGYLLIPFVSAIFIIFIVTLGTNARPQGILLSILGVSIFLFMFFARTPFRLELEGETLKSYSLIGKREVGLKNVTHMQAEDVGLFGYKMGLLNNFIPDMASSYGLILRTKDNQRFILNSTMLSQKQMWDFLPILDEYLIHNPRVQKINVISSTWESMFPYKERVKRGYK